MKRHQWHQWESWENPSEDPETTFDDLMIDHLGNFFGSMNHPNPMINNSLQVALNNSKRTLAAGLGVTVEEFEQLQVQQLLTEIDLVKKELK
jgi:hypothetical protein